jgi:hypothetical protein
MSDFLTSRIIPVGKRGRKGSVVQSLHRAFKDGLLCVLSPLLDTRRFTNAGRNMLVKMGWSSMPGSEEFGKRESVEYVGRLNVAYGSYIRSPLDGWSSAEPLGRAW